MGTLRLEGQPPVVRHRILITVEVDCPESAQDYSLDLRLVSKGDRITFRVTRNFTGYFNQMRRLTIEVAQKLAVKNGGKCLSASYRNSKSHLLWQCGKGHKWKAIIGSIKFSDSWCPRCSSLTLHDKFRARRLSSAKVDLQKIAKSKGGAWVSGEFKGENHKLTWRCANGHEWMAKPGIIRSGRWCPECSTGRGERQTRVAFEHIFCAKFPRIKPDWLLNSRGRKMELDGYNSKLGIAFEHQGEQHFEDNYFNLSKGSLGQRRQDDAVKRRLCKRQGVALLSVPEISSRLKIDDLESFIRRWANRNLAHVKVNPAKVDYLEAYKDNEGPKVLHALKSIATQRGGRCLEAVYMGSQAGHRFECKEGHVWSAKPYDVRKGAWCFKCYHKANGVARRTPLAKLEAHAKALGGKLITRASLGSRSKSEWECKNGHRWKTPENSILQGTWCPECRKWTESDLREIAASKGGELLDKDFHGAAQKMEWKCDKGHVWSAAGYRIISGAWCPTCAGVIRPTIQDMRKIAVGRNGSCLSAEYIGAHEKLEWRCDKGHKWMASPSTIKHGSWCPSCFRERLSKVKRIGPAGVLIKLAARHGGMLRSKVNMGSRVKHEWECEKGHRWMAKPTTVQQGYWCAQCARIGRQRK